MFRSRYHNGLMNVRMHAPRVLTKTSWIILSGAPWSPVGVAWLLPGAYGVARAHRRAGSQAAAAFTP